MPNYGHLSLSCTKIERPSLLEKPSCKVRLFVQKRSRKYRPKVTVTTLFQTASHPVFQLLAQMAHVCLHSRKRVHTRLSEKDRTQGHTRRNRGIPSLDHSGALCRQRNPFYSTVLLYTYISRFSVNPHYQQREKSGETAAINFIPNRSSSRFSTSCTNGPRLLLQAKVGYTLGLRRKIAHSGLHAATGGVSDGGAITTLGAFHTFRKPCVAGV